MEAAKANPQAGQQTEKKKVIRKSSASILLRSKKVLDGLLKDLASYPELQEEAKKLRDKVFNKFIEEEKAYPL